VGTDDESPVSDEDSPGEREPGWSIQRDVDKIIARWRAEHRGS
jgi:hypothetical protein